MSEVVPRATVYGHRLRALPHTVTVTTTPGVASHPLGRSAMLSEPTTHRETHPAAAARRSALENVVRICLAGLEKARDGASSVASDGAGTWHIDRVPAQGHDVTRGLLVNQRRC